MEDERVERATLTMSPIQRWAAGIAAAVFTAAIIGMGTMLFQMKEAITVLGVQFGIMQTQLETLNGRLDKLTSDTYTKAEFLRDRQILDLQLANRDTSIAGLDKRVTYLEDTCQRLKNPTKIH